MSFEDTAPGVDDVLLAEDAPSRDVESEELSAVSDFDDIEELPDIPGGDLVDPRDLQAHDHEPGDDAPAQQADA